MRTLAILIGASALLGGCVVVPPNVNPTVEVWNVQPTTDTDVADLIVEQVASVASRALEDSLSETAGYSSAEASSGCWFWCFQARTARPAPTVSPPVVTQHVAYYPVPSEPLRPIARVSTPRPAYVATPKTHVAREHAPRHTTHTSPAKPSTPKPSSKPATTSKSNTKKDKR